MKPTVEELEPRKLAADLSLTGGVLSITAHRGGDRVLVLQQGNDLVVISPGRTRHVPAAAVSLVEFRGSAGDDWFANLSDTPASAIGKGGRDVLVGSELDVLLGDRWDLVFRLGMQQQAADVAPGVPTLPAGIDLGGLHETPVIWE